MTRYPLLPMMLLALHAGADDDASALVKEGTRLVGLAKYDEAMSSFQRAYDKAPSPDLAATLIQVYPRTSLATGSEAIGKLQLWTDAMRTSGACTPARFDYLREKALPAMAWKVRETEKELTTVRAQLAEQEKRYYLKVAALQTAEEQVEAIGKRARALEAERMDLAARLKEKGEFMIWVPDTKPQTQFR